MPTFNPTPVTVGLLDDILAANVPTGGAVNSILTVTATGNAFLPTATLSAATITNEAVTNETISGTLIASIIQTSAALAAASTGTLTLSSRGTANTSNGGFFQMNRSDGTAIYLPYVL